MKSDLSNYLKIYKPIFLLLFLNQFTYAQVNNKPNQDSINKRLNIYNVRKPAASLFVHFDKNIYTNNENVWFTAYLFNCNAVEQHHTLAVSLIKDDSHKVAMEGLFMMGHGIAFGHFFLPDTLAPGNYSFVATTNRITNGKPDVSFIQPVTIKTIAEESFSVSFNLMDTSAINKTLLTVHDKNNIAVIGAAVTYKLTGEKNTITQQAKTDIAGQSWLVVPPAVRTVEAQVKVNKSVRDLNILMPVQQNKLNVRFYPEGGSMVNNLRSAIGLEVKNSAGQPVQCSAIICSNDIPFDTISTNNAGMARFSLLAQPGIKYAIKISYNSQTNTYTLPQILPSGAVLNIVKALADDTLKIITRSNQTGKVYLVVHNYKQLFSITPLNLTAFSPLLVKVNLAAIPKGVAEVTLLDSAQRPVAERLFFAKFGQKPVLNINTDKQVYGARQKVTLKLKLNGDKTTVPKGAVSIACVQANRIDPTKFNNIESYLYLKNEMDIADAQNYQLELRADNTNYLEDMLLIRGWRRYTWPDLMNSKASDTVLNHQSVLFKGSVTYLGRALKKPLAIGLLRDSATKLMTTDIAGNFVLDNEELVTAENKKVLFFANGDNDYSINVPNPYHNLNLSLASQIKEDTFQFTGRSQSTGSFLLKGFEHTTQLKEVKINGNKEGDDLYGNYHSANCNDYVCMYNVLNCRNHPFGGSIPIDGRTYAYMGRQVVYHGCASRPEPNNNILKIDGIWTSKEFYAADYAKFNPPDPEYLSTIYWKHIIGISSAKETELSFYTSDITGEFKIIVQGLTNNDVIYGSKSFMVNKP